MKHMEIAWQQEGLDTAEVAGPGANNNVLRYFAKINRPDITSDEVPWCAAFYFWCLNEAGIDISSIAKKDRLLAASALKFGTRIAEPRFGCGLVMPRYNSDGKLIGHHVAFVVSWTATTIDLLGGNQANKVCVATYKRTAKMVFMWPEPAKTPAEVAAAGSRTVAAANRQIADGAKVGVGNTLPVPPAPPPAGAMLQSAEAAAGTASKVQSLISTAESLALFAWGKWPWIVGAVSVYYVARMGWDALQIRWFRTDDANTGKAPVIAAPDVIEGEFDVVEDGEASFA